MSAAPAPPRPFRFGVLHMSPVANGATWADHVRRVEASGFSSLLLSDHFERSPLGPFAAMAHAAALTERLRLGSLVLNNDFRHPAVVAKEAATVHLLSGGRVELGLGAGWMLADYRESGLSLDEPAVRVDRLTEAVDVLVGILDRTTVDFNGAHYEVHQAHRAPCPTGPRPALLIGGSGRRVLELGARRAEIVSVNWSVRAGVVGPDALASGSPERTAAKVRWVGEQAGSRRPELHLQCYCLRVTERPIDAVSTWLASVGAGAADPAEALRSPYVMAGSLEAIEEKLLWLRQEMGFSYVSFYDAAIDDAERLVERLAGR